MGYCMEKEEYLDIWSYFAAGIFVYRIEKPIF